MEISQTDASDFRLMWLAYSVVWFALKYFTWFPGELLCKPSKLMPKMKFSHKIEDYDPHNS